MISADKLRETTDGVQSAKMKLIMEEVEKRVLRAANDGLNSVDLNSIAGDYTTRNKLEKALTDLGYKVNCGSEQRDGSWFSASW